MPAASVVLEDLTLGYDRHPAVHHLSGTFAAGSLTAVFGPNGAGKSTLLKGILGFLPPLGGAIRLHGPAPADAAYLPQRAEVDRSFPISVQDTAAMGLWRRAGVFSRLLAGQWEQVGRALAAVGLDGFAGRPVGSLSGGQFQRMLFARLMLQDARLILLDEPFAGVDFRTVEALLAIILAWAAEGRTVIAVLHDMDIAQRYFPRTLLLAREAVAWGPTAQALSPANLARARTMIEAWDERAGVCGRDGAAS